MFDVTIRIRLHSPTDQRDAELIANQIIEDLEDGWPHSGVEVIEVIEVPTEEINIGTMEEHEADVLGIALDCLECAQVRRLKFGPSHNGHATCRMGTSIAAGGARAHCTCNGCF